MTMTAARRRQARPERPAATVDWILIGVCALIWLVLLGMSVAALVALVDLGRGFDQPAHSPHTGLLYVIIGVSALIVLAAVPMLLRARRTGPTTWSPVTRAPADRAGVRPPRQGRHEHPLRAGPGGRPVDAPVGAFPAIPTPNADIVRIWLRGTVVSASIIGTALVAVSLATYLMAIGEDGAAWVCYGVAGGVTAVLPVAPWWYLRQLNRMLATR